MNNRAYSVFDVKALDSEQRKFTGWATRPSVDRVNDIIDPMGAKFVNPLPLLHQHDHTLPVGLVKFKRATPSGIEFEAEIPKVDEPGVLKDRLDSAWGEIKLGLIRAVSIGFQPIEYEYNNQRKGYDFHKISVHELSIVTIPALPEAVITSVKSMKGDKLPDDILNIIKELDTFKNRGYVKLLSKKEAKKDYVPLIVNK